MKKRVIGFILTTVLAVTNMGNLSGVQMVSAAAFSEIAEETETEEEESAEKVPEDTERMEDAPQSAQEESLSLEEMADIPELEDLPEEEQEVIGKAVSVAEGSGEAAGEILNELEEDGEAVDIGIKEVLDAYYSAESVDEETVEEFSEALEKDIEEDIENYTEAREERDNEEALDYVAGEGLVVFDKDTSEEEIDTLATYLSDSYEILIDNNFKVDTSLSERKQKRLKALEDYKGDIVVKVNLDLDQTVARAEEEFEEYDCVVDAEANEKCEQSGLSSRLNDPYADDLWYLNRCNFQDAWDSEATAGCYDIWIAVLDTGCRMTHKDLAGGLVSKYAVDVTKKDSNGQYVKLENMGKPYDSNHGTNCVGVIAAKPSNSIGIAGAARGWGKDSCRVIPVKVSSGTWENGKTRLIKEDMCNGMIHAIASGAEVISMSIYGSEDSSLYDEVINRARAAGVSIVTCAGNENTPQKQYPAARDYVIGVGGTNRFSTNDKASFSSYGDWVNIVAPATGYVSTAASGNDAYITDLTGTSFATPLVASAIGLMLAVNPYLTVDQVKSILNSTSIKINSPYFSCGMLNAGLAVQAAKYQEFKNRTVSLSSVKPLSNKRIYLEWGLDVYGPEKIEIYRSTSKTGTYSKIKTLSGSNSTDFSYIDSGLTQGKTYYYKVRFGMKYGTGYKYTPYTAVKSAKAKN